MLKLFFRYISAINLSLSLLTFSLSVSGATPQTWVTVEAIQEEQYTQTQSFVGQVISNEAGMIASEVRGRVATVLVEVGDQVKAGDVLVILDTARLELERDLAKTRIHEQEANIQAQQAKLKQAELNLERQKRLMNTPAYSRADLEDREIDLINTKAELLAHHAELERYKAEYNLANLDLERAQIRTLYSGIVTEKKVHPGAYISVGSDIVTVINQKNLEIEVNVPRQFLSVLQNKKNIDIMINKSQPIPTKLRTIVLAENVLSRTLSIRLTPSPEWIDKLIPNQSVQVLIPLAEKKLVLTVNKDALINQQGNFFVYVVKKNQAILQAITLGQPIGGKFVVLNGLKKGDLVVTRGNERLQPNQPVQYKLNNHQGEAHGRR